MATMILKKKIIIIKYSTTPARIYPDKILFMSPTTILRYYEKDP